MQELFRGFVELNYEGGVQRVEIYKDEDHIYAYVDENLADDVENAEEFKDSYGLKLYSTIEDFKRGNSISVDKVWV